MARKKGRDINGWLIVDKPAGVNSTAVVAKVEGKESGCLTCQLRGHRYPLRVHSVSIFHGNLRSATSVHKR